MPRIPLKTRNSRRPAESPRPHLAQPRRIDTAANQGAARLNFNFSLKLYSGFGHTFPWPPAPVFFREAATVASVWKASPVTHCRRLFGLPGNGLVTGRERLKATPGLRRFGSACRFVPRVPAGRSIHTA